jgi:5-(carboxyamino)imidazole ribonucleotide synthase
VNVGVLGGGQLGRMLALAGVPLGHRFVFLEPAASPCAGHVGDVEVGRYDDEARLAALAARVDVVTYEFENVPVAAARLLEGRVPVFPPPRALEASQDRLVEKEFFRSLGIPTPPFAAVGSRDELVRAVAGLGLPAVLKTRRFGYDGKGQWVLRTAADVDALHASTFASPLVLEGFVAFERELSILAVRGRGGELVFYPLVENVHRGGILRTSVPRSPAWTPELQARAESYARLVASELGYVGVLAIELFHAGGELLVNEMAPRVHNSGHWTIEGAETSQFENHVRAVVGLPLGATRPLGVSAMLNVIGTRPLASEVLAVPGAHLHDYGKSEAPNRKIGHVTLRADTREELEAGLARLRPIVDPG